MYTSPGSITDTDTEYTEVFQNTDTDTEVSIPNTEQRNNTEEKISKNDKLVFQLCNNNFPHDKSLRPLHGRQISHRPYHFQFHDLSIQ